MLYARWRPDLSTEREISPLPQRRVLDLENLGFWLCHKRYVEDGKVNEQRPFVTLYPDVHLYSSICRNMISRWYYWDHVASLQDVVARVNGMLRRKQGGRSV